MHLPENLQNETFSRRIPLPQEYWCFFSNFGEGNIIESHLYRRSECGAGRYPEVSGKSPQPRGYSYATLSRAPHDFLKNFTKITTI